MSDLIERLGKLQDSCSKQELHLLDTDYVWELAGRTADEIERLQARVDELEGAIKDMRFEAGRFTGFVELCDEALAATEQERDD